MAYVETSTANHNGWRPNANAGPQHLIPPGARRGARHFTGSQARLAGLYGLGQASDLAAAMAAAAAPDPLAGTGLSPDSEIAGTGLTASDLLAAGYSGSDIYNLSQSGAAIAAPVINSAASTTPNASAPQAAPANYLAVGAQLVYTATYTQGMLDWGTSGDLQKLQSALQKWNIGVIGSSASGGLLTNPQIQLTLQLGTAYGAAGDVKSIVDSALNSIAVGVSNSSISVTYNPQAGGTAPGSLPSASGITAWLESNWQLVAVAIFAIAIGPTLVKKIL